MAGQMSPPGVYVEERSSGTRAIAGVATSVALFVGTAKRGRVNVPIRIFDFAGFEHEFGASSSGELAVQVRQFYLNGGGMAWVCRVEDRASHADYETAYEVVAREVDLFNLLILPRAHGQSDDDRQALWRSASVFCAQRRALLLVDPGREWKDFEAAGTGVDDLRTGVETRHAAAYWPRLRIADGSPKGFVIDPCGSIAGLMARTDADRGVWKAPAGLEATIRGVVDTEYRVSDLENDALNPKALNAIRVFPTGVVSWGTRMLSGFDGSGDVDDKYISVRRTMLFIAQSLHRGLNFAAFEPNDEPLWTQIRLAVGAFMNGLFRKGAFAGARAHEAYFVRCDGSTNHADDVELGIVNAVVGFAPLKPAEFVVLKIRQIAGPPAARADAVQPGQGIDE